MVNCKGEKSMTLCFHNLQIISLFFEWLKVEDEKQVFYRLAGVFFGKADLVTELRLSKLAFLVDKKTYLM